MTSHSHVKVNVASPELQQRLRRRIEMRGLARVSVQLVIARESLARYLAAIHLQPATFAHIEHTLAKLDERNAERCPTCASPDRRFHPALELEGRVMVCPNPWHAIVPPVVVESAAPRGGL